MLAAGTGQADDLIEREGELALIENALRRAAEGSGALVVVEGPAGIGKTRLLREARRRAAGRRLRALHATGGELETGFAYGVVRQLLDAPLARMTARERRSALAGAAALAAPLLGFHDATGGERAKREPIDPSFGLLHGLYWLVANLAAERPLLLELDDAQWSDAASLHFLLYLVRRLEGLGILVTVATRTGEGGDHQALVARLVSADAARVLRPRALSPVGAAVLAASIFGEVAAEEFAAACHRATGGNPYLLRELLAALREEGVRPTVEATGAIAELGPRAVSHSVLLRLGRLPPPSHSLAQAVAVLGGEADSSHAAALAGMDETAAAGAAGALVAAGILDDGPPLRFVHPIVRTAVYEDLPAAERALAHARAARLLIDASAAPGRVASHLLASPPRGDAQIIVVLRRAAREALAEGSPDVAARYLARAVAEPPPAPDRADVLAELGMAEQRRGDPTAIGHLEASIESTSDPVVRAERRLVLARALFAAGRRDAAVAALDAGIADSAPLDRELMLRLEGELSTFGLIDVEVARFASDRLERFDGVRGETAAERVLLTALATRAWAQCRPASEAAELARRALAGGRLVAEQTADAPTVYQAIFTLLLADELDDARAALDEAFADARARGLVFGFAAASSLRAMLAARCGDIASTEAEARAGIEATKLHGVVTPLALAFLIEALVARGAVDGAEAALAGSGFGDDFPQTAPFLSLLFRRGLLRFAQGRDEDGLADLSEVGVREERLGMASPVTSRRCIAGLAHAAAGRRAEGARLVAEHLELARRWGTPSSIGVGLRAQGLLAEDGGLDLLREAVATLERSPARLDLAQALVDLGSGLRRARRRAEARDALHRAHDIARDCGGTVIAQRARDELVVTGARPRRRAFSGVESLTAAERRVAGMAAGGMSNRDIAQALFVTVRTVENHLARVYTKLNVHSRAELPNVLRENE